MATPPRVSLSPLAASSFLPKYANPYTNPLHDSFQLTLFGVLANTLPRVHS